MGTKNNKEVYFAIWCPICKHYTKLEEALPCCECLTVPAREYSKKPEHWEASENAKDREPEKKSRNIVIETI